LVALGGDAGGVASVCLDAHDPERKKGDGEAPPRKRAMVHTAEGEPGADWSRKQDDPVVPLGEGDSRAVVGGVLLGDANHVDQPHE